MIYMKLFNKFSGGTKLFNKVNNESNGMFGKFTENKRQQQPTLAKIGHFISKINRNDLEKGSKQNTKEQQGPIYK